MAYVIDTHALIWYLTDNKNLGEKARNILRLTDISKEKIIIPSIVLAEVLYICENKEVGIKFNDILEKLDNSNNYFCYDLNLEVVLKLDELKKIKEIHDRVIVATALLTNAMILTKDKNIRDSKYTDTIW